MNGFGEADRDAVRRRALLAAGLALFPLLLALAALAGLALMLVGDLERLGRPGWLTLAALLWALLIARWWSFLAGAGEEPGREVTAANQPRLLRMVAEVCRRTGCPLPGRVVLVPGTGLYCVDRCQRWGFSWLRELRLGLALVDRLPGGALRAILAGELLVGENLRGRLQMTIARTDAFVWRALDESGRSALIVPLEWYLRLFLAAARPASAAQRRAALDRAALAAGGDVHQRGLALSLATARSFGLFLHQEVLGLLAAGGLPDNVYEGFRVWLQRVRKEENDLPPPEQSPDQGRLAPAGALREGEPWDDPAPARSLLEAPEIWERRVTPFVAEAFRRQGMRRIERRPLSVSWEEVEKKIVVPLQRARARHALETLESMLSRRVDVLEGIDVYLKLIDVPELRDRLAVRLDPNLARIPPALHQQLAAGILVRFLGTLVGNALVEGHDYRWNKEIAEPLRVVGRSGERLDPFLLASDLLEGRVHVGTFRMRLFEHGLFAGR